MDKATKKLLQSIAEGKVVFYLGKRFRTVRGLHQDGYVRLKLDHNGDWIAKLTREGAEHIFNEKQKGHW